MGIGLAGGWGPGKCDRVCGGIVGFVTALLRLP